MKYAVTIRFFNGTTAGYTVTAEDADDAWKKLCRTILMRYVQSVQMAEMLTEFADIK